MLTEAHQSGAQRSSLAFKSSEKGGTESKKWTPDLRQRTTLNISSSPSYSNTATSKISPLLACPPAFIPEIFPAFDAHDDPTKQDFTKKISFAMPGSCLSRAHGSLLGGPHFFYVNPPLPCLRLKRNEEYPLEDADVSQEGTKAESIWRRGNRHSLSPASKRGSSSFDTVELEENSASNSSNSDEEDYFGQLMLTRRPSKDSYKLSQNRDVFSLRTRESIIVHFLIELALLRGDLMFILFGLFFQLVHSAFTNLAYYNQSRLTAAQRVPLSDVSFDVLPELSGRWWSASEVLIYIMVGIVVACIVPILVLRWHVPHGRPLYCIVIVRRMLMVLCLCQALRIVSFMVTTLPGSSRQCLYQVPQHLTAKEMVEGPADPEGNPTGWKPPQTWYDVLFHIDVTNGCGDLMFSSHTIFTMTFVEIVWKYFNWPFLKQLMLLLQISIVPLILASHKHYTVDVITALYVTPLVFELLWVRFPDKGDLSCDLSEQYDIRFYLSSSFRYGELVCVVEMWGKDFYVDPGDMPVDLASSSAASKRMQQTERAPIIV